MDETLCGQDVTDSSNIGGLPVVVQSACGWNTSLAQRSKSLREMNSKSGYYMINIAINS